MFLDIVGVITTSKLNILSTFQGGGAPGAPPMSSRVNCHQQQISTLLLFCSLFTHHSTLVFHKCDKLLSSSLLCIEMTTLL